MATKKKLLQAAAGVGGGGGLNVEDVFSTQLYKGEIDGTQSSGYTRKITNGLDLSTEGGMVWIKRRNLVGNHYLYDTERNTGSPTKHVITNNNDGETSDGDVIQYETDGFSFLENSYNQQYTPYEYTSFSFRKAPKFFDVVTYTGNGTAGRTVSHNLGTDVGFMVIKQTSASGEHWICYHRSLGASSPIYLNLTSAASSSTSLPFNSTAPTSTEFTLGNWSAVNGNGASYVAYLFAHNDGDGEFGPDGDADIIKCGSYTGDDLDDGPEINLGFEPQWLLVKNASTARNWIIVDNMRGISTNGNDANLYPNLLNAEDPAQQIRLTPTGFKCEAGGDNFNGNGHTMIYIAIRRGPMAVPESATDVFDIDINTANTDPTWSHPFPVDFAFYKHLDNVEDWFQGARLIQGSRYRFNNQATLSNSTAYAFDYMDGWFTSSTTANYASWAWRRAPQFFDVVSYDGSSSNRTVTHNLEAVPEMIWVRTLGQNAPFAVYHKDAGADHVLFTHTTAAKNNITTYFNSTTPTSSVFSLGTNADVNYSAYSYIAYLFTSLDGISKVGSYTGTGSAQNIDCGFSAGARFILIKRLDSGSDWFLFDTVRGIQTGTDDKMLHINDDDAEFHSFDYVNPSSNGFAVGSIAAVNASGGTFGFYAIA